MQHLMESTKQEAFRIKESENLEESLLVNQWLEYGNLFVHNISMSDDKNLTKALLDELNNYLVIKSYLVGESLTVADLVVFFFIQDIMVGPRILLIHRAPINSILSFQKYLTYLDKERYLNLSRWYNHIQQLAFVQTSEKPINLSTTYLVGWATGTHA